MKYNGNNIEEVIAAHKEWLAEPVNTRDTNDERIADFSFTKIETETISDSDLSYANFFGSKIEFCHFHNCHFKGSNFGNAIIKNSWFNNGIFDYADFTCAQIDGGMFLISNLYCTDLTNSFLRRLSFVNSKLIGVPFNYSNIYGVYFDACDLNKSSFASSNISLTSIKECTNIPHIHMACPSSGEFIGWKKALIMKDNVKELELDHVVVKLKIPEDALRSSAVGTKCRCNKAVVLSIESLDGTTLPTDAEAHSIHDENFVYRVGEEVSVYNFDTNRFNECAPGIHFFIDRGDAVEY